MTTEIKQTIEKPKLKREEYINFIVRHEKCNNPMCKKDIDFCMKQIAKLDLMGDEVTREAGK
jgi:hypothetical protein